MNLLSELTMPSGGPAAESKIRGGRNRLLYRGSDLAIILAAPPKSGPANSKAIK
jgi:hypothetical protein